MNNYEILDNTGVKPFIGAFDKAKTIHYTILYNKVTAACYSEEGFANRLIVNQAIRFLWQLMRFKGRITLNDIYDAFSIGDISFRTKDGDEWGILFDKDHDDRFTFSNFMRVTAVGSDNDFMFAHGYEYDCEIKFDLVNIEQAQKLKEE